MNCNQRKIPSGFSSRDVSGFMIGSKSETWVELSKMVLQNGECHGKFCRVSKVYHMSWGIHMVQEITPCGGKAYDPRLIYAWPTAQNTSNERLQRS